jgi:uncharacterized membrane protein
MAVLTVGTAFLIGGAIIVVSTITAAVMAQLSPRRVLRHSEEEQRHQRYTFADTMAVPTIESEEAMRHPPPRLLLEHLTALPNRN